MIAFLQKSNITFLFSAFATIQLCYLNWLQKRDRLSLLVAVIVIVVAIVVAVVVVVEANLKSIILG